MARWQGLVSYVQWEIPLWDIFVWEQPAVFTQLQCHFKIFLPDCFSFLPSPFIGGLAFQSEGFPYLLLFFHWHFPQQISFTPNSIFVSFLEDPINTASRKVDFRRKELMSSACHLLNAIPWPLIIIGLLYFVSKTENELNQVNTILLHAVIQG